MLGIRQHVTRKARYGYKHLVSIGELVLLLFHGQIYGYGLLLMFFTIFTASSHFNL